MAVKTENVNLKEIDAEYNGIELLFHNPVRFSNGKWRWPMQVAVTVTLPDGRKLVVNETIITTAKQIGRLPNPNAFGRKQK